MPEKLFFCGETGLSGTMRLVLYQPEIAANVGAAIRITACFGAALEIIEPCGFPLKHKDIKRVSLDYGALRDPGYHASWQGFSTSPERQSARLVLLSSKAETPLYDFAFQPGDMLMIGQESAGVPDHVREACDGAVRIPMATGARSLNMAVAGAVGLSEMQRQVSQMPPDTKR